MVMAMVDSTVVMINALVMVSVNMSSVCDADRDGDLTR